MKGVEGKTINLCIAIAVLMLFGQVELAFCKESLMVSTIAVSERANAMSEPPIAAAQVPGEGAEEPTETGETKAGYGEGAQFGGPNSVGAQLRTDDEIKRPVFKLEGLHRAFKPYWNFKSKLNEKYGFQFGGDYNALIQDANQSLGEDTAAGGVFRFFGQWTLFGRGSENTGTLVYKLENRHRLGTEISPQQLAREIGYAGLTAQTFSNVGWELTNFFWHQQLLDGRLGVVAGAVDVTDYVDTYGLFNPWTDFSNLAFGTDPTIAAPNQGLGAAARVTIEENYYLLAGIADANGDPTDPGNFVHSFFSDAEFFTHLEVGWASSWENRFSDNIHLTAWRADERKQKNMSGGWGAAFSFNRVINDRWLPFVRLGLSDGGGGAPLERSVSMGLGYYMRGKSDMLGLGLNWGRPSEETFGSGLSDQYTTELYYRLMLFQYLAITPDIQWIIHPALNPHEDQMWVFGLRARLEF